MASPVRPVKTFIVRFWQEPGASGGDAAWRGLVRTLEAGRPSAGPVEVAFHGLDNLPQAVRPLLIGEAPPAAQADPP